MVNYLKQSKIKFRYLKTNTDTYTIIDMFMSDWLSDVCQHEYIVNNGLIVFNVPEDAVIAKLKGIPPTLSNHIMYVM